MKGDDVDTAKAEALCNIGKALNLEPGLRFYWFFAKWFYNLRVVL